MQPLLSESNSGKKIIDLNYSSSIDNKKRKTTSSKKKQVNPTKDRAEQTIKYLESNGWVVNTKKHRTHRGMYGNTKRTTYKLIAPDGRTFDTLKAANEHQNRPW